MFCWEVKQIFSITNVSAVISGVLYHSIISSFRWMTVGFSIATIIILVQILDRLNLDRSTKLQENTSIPAQSKYRVPRSGMGTSTTLDPGYQ